MRFWIECGDFFRESRRNFRDIGSLLPSSRFLAHALVSELKKRRSPGRILEVGPGTGSVTAQILRHLLPGDQLDLVELNTHFIDLLQGRFDREWKFWRHRDQVRLVHSAVERLPGEGVYDYIISGLPLNNFPVAQVREIYQVYSRLLKRGGTLTYFEYVWIRHLKTSFATFASSPARRPRGWRGFGSSLLRWHPFVERPKGCPAANSARFCAGSPGALG